MLLNVSVIMTKNTKTQLFATAALEIGGQYSETLPVELAKSVIALWGLKEKEMYSTTKLKNNNGHIDVVYS